MKFNDKLQKIRKENNITQEMLADKLNVSRQAVSKWESGLAYPDTEKLILISKIFNVSLDDLINDNIDKNMGSTSKKIDFIGIFNEGLSFISKTVNMFLAMKFMEKIKCLFEIVILILIIFGISMLSTSILVDIIRRIFMFMPNRFLYYFVNLFETLLLVVWLVLGMIIVIKIFKSRYLDYYVIVVDDNVSEKTIEEPIKELKEKREYKVVIRDPRDSSLNIFKKISKVCIFLIKCFGFLMMIPLILLFVVCMMVLVYSLFYMFSGLFFIGINVSMVGIILFVYLMIEFGYNLLSNRKHNVNVIFLIFILSISLVGIGIGLSFVSLSDFTYEDNIVGEVNAHVIEMDDNLILDFMVYGDGDIIIDNSLDNIKLEITSYLCNDTYLYNYNNYRKSKDYLVYDISYDCNEFELYKEIVSNLENKKIINNTNGAYRYKMYVSQDNLTKLEENINDFNGYVVFYR